MAPPEQKIRWKTCQQRDPVERHAVGESCQEGVSRSDASQKEHAAQAGLDDAKATGLLAPTPSAFRQRKEGLRSLLGTRVRGLLHDPGLQLLEFVLGDHSVALQVSKPGQLIGRRPSGAGDVLYVVTD